MRGSTVYVLPLSCHVGGVRHGGWPHLHVRLLHICPRPARIRSAAVDPPPLRSEVPVDLLCSCVCRLFQPRTAREVCFVVEYVTLYPNRRVGAPAKGVEPSTCLLMFNSGCLSTLKSGVSP